MRSRYHLYCDVWSESYPQCDEEDEEEYCDAWSGSYRQEEEEEEEEEEDHLVTVQIRYWKIEQPDLELTAVGRSRLREFDLLDAVEYNGELFDVVPIILTEFGIKEECHQAMIDALVKYIEEIVIHVLYGVHVRVYFDIVDATVETGEPHVEEAVRRSIIIETDSKIRRSSIVQMDSEEEGEESECAKDNLEDVKMCDVMLQEPVSYVGEVVKVMGESKVSVKVHPEGKYFDSCMLHLPSNVDPLINLMKVEKVPDSTYDMIGGLDQQIKEMKEDCHCGAASCKKRLY